MILYDVPQDEGCSDYVNASFIDVCIKIYHSKIESTQNIMIFIMIFKCASVVCNGGCDSR